MMTLGIFLGETFIECLQSNRYCIRYFHRPSVWVKQVVKGRRGSGKDKDELPDWSWSETAARD